MRVTSQSHQGQSGKKQDIMPTSPQFSNIFHHSIFFFFFTFSDLGLILCVILYETCTEKLVFFFKKKIFPASVFDNAEYSEGARDGYTCLLFKCMFWAPRITRFLTYFSISLVSARLEQFVFISNGKLKLTINFWARLTNLSVS